MQDFPLSITQLFRHGRKIHSGSKILNYNGPDAEIEEATFAEVGDSSDQLAAALARLG